MSCSELAHRSDHRAGGDVDVRFVYSTGADGRPVRHVIVDIPGVDTLNPSPNGADPTSFGTNLRTLVGARSTYGDGVIEAMRQAGVTPADPVLLVGHSQGGMVAMNLAKELAGRGTFHITNVITVGSPVAHITVPRSVRVLAIENDDDFVPHLDGASNPDQTNLTTVTIHREHQRILDNHDLDQELPPRRRRHRRLGQPVGAVLPGRHQRLPRRQPGADQGVQRAARPAAGARPRRQAVDRSQDSAVTMAKPGVVYHDQRHGRTDAGLGR